MPELSSILLFALASFVLIVVPGPAVLYVITRSLDQGRMAGVVSVLGVSVGAYVHIFAAALGILALLASSALAFSVVKYLGAAYLIYLGLQKLLAKQQDWQADAVKQAPLRKIFVDGIVVNVLNPKAALFFLAFLPQFIDVSRGYVSSQILVLGTVFVIVALISDGAYALLAGTAGSWLKKRKGFARVQNYVSGSIYVILGVTAALTGNSKK